MMSILTLLQILVPIGFVISICLFLLRLKQIYRDQMSQTMKILHLSYMPLYVLFNIIQVCNSFGFKTVNNNCRIWYILSMLFLWCARFIFTLEMFYRLFIIFIALQNNASPRPYIYGMTIIFVICLLCVCIFNNSIKGPEGICIPQYDNTLAPIIIIHCIISILSVGSVIFLVKQFHFYANSAVIYSNDDDAIYQMKKLLRKFVIFSVSLIISSIFILFCSIYADAMYGLFICYDGIFIVFMDILLYKQYDWLFIGLCKCFLPEPPPDKVKNLQQIADLYAIKYKNEFESVILKTLKDNNDTNIFISDDVINIIFSYVTPITDLETNFIYKPYWKPVTNLRNADSKTYFTASKYGGVPYLTLNEEWPRCNICHQRLYLFLQINVNTLPKEYIHQWWKHANILHQNQLLQYFHCITLQCFRERTDAVLLRFIRVEQGQTNAINDTDDHFQFCLDEYMTFKMSNIGNGALSPNAWMENIIDEWNKQEIDQGIFHQNQNDNEDEKYEIYNFDKYEYETPSLNEYNQFCLGIFDGLEIISKEIVKHNLGEIDMIENLLKKPSGIDKLCGYYVCLADSDNIPICNICNNYMRNMIYQVDGEFAGFIYKKSRIGAIFICDNHPFEPQLIMLQRSDRNNLPF
eukprot:437580_1